MRDLKFRAWDSKNKEMYYNLIPFHQICKTDNGFISSNHEFIIEEGMDIPSDNEFILMQYTGIKDKNKKQIYEGDYLDINGCIVEVRFSSGAFIVEYFIVPTSSYLGHFDYTDIEVIGNVYETPELLKDNKLE